MFILICLVIIVLLIIVLLIIVLLKNWPRIYVFFTNLFNNKTMNNDIIGYNPRDQYDSMNEEIRNLKKEIERYNEKKSGLKTQIRELKESIVLLKKEQKNTEAAIEKQKEELSILQDEARILSAGISDLYVANELRQKESSVLNSETLKLFGTAYSMLSSDSNSSNAISLAEDIKDYLTTNGYELIPYSEMNKDYYIIRNVGVEKNIRIAIKNKSTDKLVVSGEIYI